MGKIIVAQYTTEVVFKIPDGIDLDENYIEKDGVISHRDKLNYFAKDGVLFITNEITGETLEIEGTFMETYFDEANQLEIKEVDDEE